MVIKIGQLWYSPQNDFLAEITAGNMYLGKSVDDVWVSDLVGIEFHYIGELYGK